MLKKSLLAFGTRTVLVNVEANETPADFIFSNDGRYNDALTFYTKGCVSIKILETNEQLPDRLPGWLNSPNQPIKANTGGTAQMTFPEASEWLCIPKVLNKNTLPDVSSLALNIDEQVVLVNNSNIYLVRGVITLNDKTYTGPCHIRLRSGDATATSVDKSYSLIFPIDPNL